MNNERTPNINLFIVGAAKSGTTSLYNYLQQHPDVFLPRVKEPHFYSEVESHNPEAYLNPEKGQFYHDKVIKEKEIYFSLYRESKSQKILADASPSYLFDELAPERIFINHPNSKIVILLRDPVQRAFSHYLMDIRHGHQVEEDFLKAIKKDLNALPKKWGVAHLYIELGFYFQQTKRYIDFFGKENVKIILYDDFVQKTEEVLIDLCDFIDINKEYISRINYRRIYNEYATYSSSLSKYILKYKNRFNIFKTILPSSLINYLKERVIFKKKEKPRLLEEEKSYLYNIYKKDIEMTEKLINRDLGSWKLEGLIKTP